MTVRFGESNLHSCDIILRDIEESNRVNDIVKKQQDSNQKGSLVNKMAHLSRGSQMVPLDKMQLCIISGGYW